MINVKKAVEDAVEGLRIAEVATEGPIRVNQYDNEGGVISYQLQQDGPGDAVLCAFDDDEDERAIFDSLFHADAHTRAPEAYRNVIALAEALESEQALVKSILNTKPHDDLVAKLTAEIDKSHREHEACKALIRDLQTENEYLRAELAETKARLKPYADAELDYVRDL